MHSYFILYSALAVFGIGVTIIDLLGVFDPVSSTESGDADGTEATDILVDGPEAVSTTSIEVSDIQEGGSEVTAILDDATNPETQNGDQGSWVASGFTRKQQRVWPAPVGGSGNKTLTVAKFIGTLRTGVYFSLGAGPTGLFALFTGIGGTTSLAWSTGAGVFIAILAKMLRTFVRRDLDSSIKPEEFLMDLAVISVPVSPGALGKALVMRYGRETELYVRCKDQNLALAKGETVRIVDLDDECYWVEAHG